MCFGNKTEKNLNEYTYSILLLQKLHIRFYFLALSTDTDYLAMEEGNFTIAEQRQISWALFGDSPAERTYDEIK